ncbi:MAG: PEFG-CTERM sorting domain-containing protein [Nitrosopumilales archaeon]|nr:PEFG-CTERM sorting domain-containing protein [Nitrosopumilales archaeon]
MKITTTSTIFVFLAVIAGVITTPAFASHATATVSIPEGSGASQDAPCVADNSCFMPAEVTVDVGGEVTWSNDDTAAHTVTSGDLSADPDNVGADFDSSLFMAGKTFSHKFDAAGEYPYFCMVHPWMVGTVIVQEAMAEEPEDDGMMEGMTELYGMSSDGTVKVEIEASTPTAGEAMTINLEFTDAATGTVIEHINYDITATQAGTTVLEMMAVHEHMGTVSHTTDALSSGDPVDVSITLQGIGIDTKTGPMGDVVMFTVVPEFGTIAVMILGVAIVSIIAMSARSKIIPRI